MNEAIDILTFLGIPGDKISHYQVVDNDSIMTIYVELKDIRSFCPYCKSNKIKIKDYYETSIKHSIIFNKKIVVTVRNRRYVCSNCKKTFKQNFSLVEKGSIISVATKAGILDDLKTKKTLWINVLQKHNLLHGKVGKLCYERFKNGEKPVLKGQELAKRFKKDNAVISRAQSEIRSILKTAQKE
jgi:transposase